MSRNSYVPMSVATDRLRQDDEILSDPDLPMKRMLTPRKRARSELPPFPFERADVQSEPVGHASRRPKTGVGFGDNV